jgi:hypothetical protein
MAELIWQEGLAEAHAALGMLIEAPVEIEIIERRLTHADQV